MREEFGGRHDFAAVDVSDAEVVGKWVRQTEDRFGAPHLLLNNAAAIARNAPVWELAESEVEKVLRVNVNGTINVLRHFVPGMIARSAREPSVPGVIVNFSSGWGRSTSPDVGIYCASKWAIEGLTRSLAQDLAHTSIRAYALNPGIIDTEMLRECFGDSAGGYPSPKEWVKQAGPYLLSLVQGGTRPNSVAISVPGTPLD